ncbi:MAG TPA: hypothetical protein VGF33_10030 [Caulobacteraceae bacterium]|jgi:hypothetical protein
MNNARRADIKRAEAMIAEAMDILSTAASEEQDFHDNMPESIQQGERGDRAQEAADALQQAADDLSNIDLTDATS